MSWELQQLDRDLARLGETITLRRPSGAGSSVTYTDVTVRAAVTDVSQMELAAGLKMTDQKVIMSPTEMTNASWPAPPRINDKAVIGGRTRNVTFVKSFSINDVICRYELIVSG